MTEPTDASEAILYKRPRNSQDITEVSSSNLDVDALVEEVLREDVEEFDIRSTPLNGSNVEELVGLDNTLSNSSGVEEIFSNSENDDFELYYTDSDSVENLTEREESVMVVESDKAEGEYGEGEGEYGEGEYEHEYGDHECEHEHEYDHEREHKHEDSSESFHKVSGDSSSVATDSEPEEEEEEDCQTLLEKIIQEVMTYGPNLFVNLKMEAQESPEALLESLGYPLPQGLIHADFVGKWNFVRRFLLKYVYERPRLGVSSVEDAVELVRSAKRILVLTGAGISVSCGIPDFRSENGLYAQIQDRFSLPEPECMFDIEFFRIDPEPFFTFAKELLPKEEFKPSFSHHFIRHLEQQGKLLRQFTQNIDTLEASAGIERVVYCHGSFATASCLDCGEELCIDELKKAMDVEIVPSCQKCTGIVKPDIVFFGESLPKAFDDHIATDCNEADLVLVIGSSLKVHPVSSIPGILQSFPSYFLDLIPPYVPQILINRESLDHNFDIELLGDCDLILAELFRRLEWKMSDKDTQTRFIDLIESPTTCRFIGPNYHIFPGAKASAEPNEPPRISGSPVSSEGLIGNDATEHDDMDVMGGLNVMDQDIDMMDQEDLREVEILMEDEPYMVDTLTKKEPRLANTSVKSESCLVTVSIDTLVENEPCMVAPSADILAKDMCPGESA